MGNSISSLQEIAYANKTFNIHDVTGLESELFDAILTSRTIFSFKDFCKKQVIRNYTQEEISKALQSLQNKIFLSHDSKFNIIKLHLQSVFPYSTPQISDYWIC